MDIVFLVLDRCVIFSCVVVDCWLLWVVMYGIVDVCVCSRLFVVW